MSAVDLLIRDYESLRGQVARAETLEERERALNRLQQAKANISMARRLEAAGIDVPETLAPATKKPEKSALLKIAEGFDTAGNWTRKNVVAPALGIDTKGRDKVYGSDILDTLGWKDDTTASRIGRGVAGFGLEVATDPLTYLTFGAGSGIKAGGKVLSKSGQKAFREIAEGTARNVGEKIPNVFKRAELGFLARHGSDPSMYSKSGVKFMGQRVPVISDMIEGAGRGLKKQWNELEDLANPVLQAPAGDLLGERTIGMKEKIARAVVPTVKSLGEAVSTKFGLPEEFVARRKLYRSALDRAKFETAEDVKQLYEGLSKIDRKKIALYLDSPEKYAAQYESLYGPLDRRLQDVADETARRLKAYGTELRDKGLIESMRENYISHLIGRDLPSHMRTPAGSGGVSTTMGGLQKERAFDTLGDIFDAYPELRNVTELDASKILANYEWQAKKSLLGKEFLGDVDTAFSRGDIPFRDALRGNLTDYNNGRGTVIKNIPTAIARNLAELDKTQKGATTLIGKMWDAAMGGFKKMVTIPFPAFHVRNAGSNTVLNFMDVGASAFNPLAHVEAQLIKGGKAGGFQSRNGIKYTYDDVRELAKEYGVLKGDTWGMGPLDKAIDFGAGQKIRESNLNPLKWGRKAGGFVEDEGRIFNFVTNLKRGLSPENAAKHVDDFIFDYGDLSKVDRSIKRLIPFYTFLRKNAELHAKALIANPGRVGAEFRMGRNFAQALFGGEQVAGEDLAGLPEFFQEGLKVVSRTPGKDALEIVSGLGLPIEDLEENPLLVALTGGDLGRSITRYGGGRMTPVVKGLLDLAFNKDTFFGAPLEGRQENKDGTVDYPYTKAYPILKNMPDFVKDFLEFEEIQRPTGTVYRMNPKQMKKFELFTLGMLSRVYSSVGKAFDTNKTAGQKAIDLLTGVKTYELQGEDDLAERAAQRRTSQVSNLLMGKIGAERYRGNL